MKWTEARRRLFGLAVRRDGAQADARPGLASSATGAPAETPDTPRLIDKRAVSLCVASGKGGTGKSVVSAALAQLLAVRGRTLVLDADLGVGNAHILQDVSPERTLVDVAEGRLSVADVRTACGESVDLIAAGSGVPRMADLTSYEMHLIAHGLDALEPEYAYLVTDCGAGISRQTMAFAEASDLTLIVTTPDLTAMTDAYAFLKVLFARPTSRALLVVNRAESEEEAVRVERRIAEVCDRFLGRVPDYGGWIPNDPAVTRAVNHRSSVTVAAPDSEAARALRILAVRVLEELGRGHPRGFGRHLIQNLGYSSRGA